jgi:hypothetical protein
MSDNSVFWGTLARCIVRFPSYSRLIPVAFPTDSRRIRGAFLLPSGLAVLSVLKLGRNFIIAHRASLVESNWRPGSGSSLGLAHSCKEEEDQQEKLVSPVPGVA